MKITWIVRNWFLAGLLTAAGLAFVFPAVGARGGPLAPEVTAKAAVAIIFLLQGLALSPEALRAGAMRWRLHSATQLFIFALFPAVVLAADHVAGPVLGLSPEIRVGFIFLAVLPTTVSTCVVLTAVADGNVAGALFNAVFANLAGVLLTPLWAALLIGSASDGPPLHAMVLEIALLLLAPLVAGQLLRPALARRNLIHRRLVSVLSNAILLFIVFTAFANSVHDGAFRTTGPAEVALVLLCAIVLFAVAASGAWLLGRRLAFDPADARALFFCAPQKTLAAGVPMAQILFAGNPALALILLPLMVYHVAQLIAGAFLADRLRMPSAAA